MRGFAGLIGLLALAACQTTTIEPAKLGAVYSGTFIDGGSKVPLPPGEWTVAGTNIRETNLGNVMSQSILFQADKGIVKGMVVVLLSRTPGSDFGNRSGWESSRYCQRTNLWFLEVDANETGGEQDCWGVNHRVMTPAKWDRYPAWSKARDYIEKNNLKVASNMVFVFYTLATNNDYLSAKYYFNPELEGLSPPAADSWTRSDWHKDRIAEHPDKQTYAERLKTWGEKWRLKVREDFDGSS